MVQHVGQLVPAVADFRSSSTSSRATRFSPCLVSGDAQQPHTSIKTIWRLRKAGHPLRLLRGAQREKPSWSIPIRGCRALCLQSATHHGCSNRGSLTDYDCHRHCKLPAVVFKTWLAELAREREVLNRPTTLKPTRISRSEFLQEYKSAVARRLKVFTNRENVALSREALRNVLVDGRLVLRPDVANARLEGTLTLSHEEFLKEKQIDIKMVAGAGFEPATFGL